MKRLLALLMLLLLLPGLVAAGEEEEVSLFSGSPTALPATAQPAAEASPAPQATAGPAAAQASARDEFIDRMLGLAKELYDKAGGRAQPANEPGHIYVCKNFTVHMFRKNRDSFRMAAFPDMELRIPNNLPAKESKPYSYGIAWEDISPEQGNPFYAAHAFYYNSDISQEENRQLARAFMREVKRGDFFQMSAKYYYGVGAHSAVFTQDYNPATDSVFWTDSNMKGESRGGKRYGYVQYDAERPIDWFVDAFCQRGRGATLYRLRDDIILR